MKKIKHIFLLLITAIFFTNCVSVVEVFDQWEGEQLGAKNNQKVLVVYKTNDKASKERFEKDMANRLRKSGVNAVESFIAFPNFESKKRTEKEVEDVVNLLKDAGFTSAVVTGIKSKIEMSKTNTTGGYDKDMSTGIGTGISIYNYSYHYYGFGSFYGGVYNSNVGSIYIEPESSTVSYNVYTIETVTYNLNKEKEEQIAGILIVKITDPSSYEEIADKYTKIVTKQFKKIR